MIKALMVINLEVRYLPIEDKRRRIQEKIRVEIDEIAVGGRIKRRKGGRGEEA
jgi:hypothetical protein